MRPRFAVGLAVVALIWGASFMFIKIMIGELAPIAVAWIRLGGGAVFILAVATLSGRRLPPLRRWGDVAVVAVFGSALPYMLIPWGERQIAAGLAAILNAATPFFAAIFGHLLLSSERISPTRAAGLTLGFVGVAVVIGPNLLHISSAGTLGQLAVVLASASCGLGAVYLRRRLRDRLDGAGRSAERDRLRADHAAADRGGRGAALRGALAAGAARVGRAGAALVRRRAADLLLAAQQPARRAGDARHVPDPGLGAVLGLARARRGRLDRGRARRAAGPRRDRAREPDAGGERGDRGGAGRGDG